jgi:hypothetical protein
VYMSIHDKTHTHTHTHLNTDTHKHRHKTRTRTHTGTYKWYATLPAVLPRNRTRTRKGGMACGVGVLALATLPSNGCFASRSFNALHLSRQRANARQCGTVAREQRSRLFGAQDRGVLNQSDTLHVEVAVTIKPLRYSRGLWHGRARVAFPHDEGRACGAASYGHRQRCAVCRTCAGRAGTSRTASAARCCTTAPRPCASQGCCEHIGASQDLTTSATGLATSAPGLEPHLPRDLSTSAPGD